MKSTDIKALKWNNNEVTALYMGSNLLFRRKIKNNGIIAGKFRTAGDYSINVNEESVPVHVDDDLSFELVVPEQLYSCNDMFMNQQITELTSLPDTSQVTDMGSMFSGCNYLTNIIDFDTSNVKTMNSMFYGCGNFRTLTLKFDTSQVTNMCGMFRAMNGINFGILDISTFDTSRVTDMSDMFNTCSKLTTLHLGDNFDMSNVTDVTYMFFYDSKLTTVTGTITGINVDLKLNPCPLTAASAMVFINGLKDGANKTLTLKTITYNSLSNDQIAIASQKGWTVAQTNSMF